MTQVAAGILERDGMILICRRRSDQAHALKWEFPGGKVEPGESVQGALVRELQEELAIQAVPGRELLRYCFAYPGKNPLLLVFIAVQEWRGEIENRIFDSIEWTERSVLSSYDFLEGDVRFLEWFTAPDRVKTECSAID